MDVAVGPTRSFAGISDAVAVYPVNQFEFVYGILSVTCFPILVVLEKS